jgi:hypothetical protein
MEILDEVCGILLEALLGLIVGMLACAWDDLRAHR